MTGQTDGRRTDATPLHYAFDRRVITDFEVLGSLKSSEKNSREIVNFIFKSDTNGLIRVMYHWLRRAKQK